MSHTRLHSFIRAGETVCQRRHTVARRTVVAGLSAPLTATRIDEATNYNTTVRRGMTEFCRLSAHKECNKEFHMSGISEQSVVDFTRSHLKTNEERTESSIPRQSFEGKRA
jgi:hypothetical protein